ncbi:exodeoxyribonuclease III [bacterium]|nr:exodeoxyribonuclease III [candidate division CSSED10-310 bacterium]
MKIVTFNANSIRARLPLILTWIDQNQPDILAVQETKVQDDAFPSSDFKSMGYSAVFSGQKAYNGVAVISRQPPDDVVYGFDDQSEKPRLIRCRFGDLHIINSYVPQGRDRESEYYQYKLNWLRRMHDLLQINYTPETNLIWLGDLNVAPDPEDVYDPKNLDGHVCFNSELSELFRHICEWGLHDVFRKHHPEPGHFTFYDYRMRGSVSRNNGWRIDHILATRSMYALSEDAWIDLDARQSKDPKPSDHTFLTALFRQSES